jgi:hypothetical protein
MATQTPTTTWDVRVVAFDDATNILSYVPRWESLEFSDQLNGVGSGKITHDLSDPWFADFELEHGSPLLTGPFSLQIVRNNNPVFTFFVQDVDASRIGSNQPVTISGPGIASSLEWAVVMPEDVSGQTLAGSIASGQWQIFDRLFPGYYHDARVATTGPLPSCVYAAGFADALPGVGATLIASSFGKLNDTGIDGVTELYVGDRILVKDQVNSAHNGVYWITDIGSSVSPWKLRRHARCDGSPIADLEVGNDCWVQQGTTNGYTAWSLSNNSGFNSGTQVGTSNLTWTQNTTGTYTGISAFWLLFEEAITGYQLYTAQSIFGDVNSAAGRGGIDFAVTWPLFIDPSVAAVNGTIDSNGMVVQDGGPFNIPAGKNMLEVLGQVTAQTGTTWYVGPTGEIKIAITPFVGDNCFYDTPLGVDRTSGSAAKLFTLPMMEAADTKTQSGGRRTVVYGTNGLNLDRMVSSQSATYGIRESYFENSSSDTSTAVANITTSAMRKVDGGKLQVTAKINESYGYQAWIDFAVGDKVLVENTVGNYVEQIISAISSSISADGDTTIEVTFGEVFPDVATNLYAAAGFGATSASELSVFSGQPARNFLTAPTSTSVIPKTTGLSNRAIINWASSESLTTSSYDVTVFKKEQTYDEGTSQWVTVTREALTLERSSNIVTITTSAPHGFIVGNIVDVSDTSPGFGGTGIPIISVPNSTTFLYANNGPNDSVISINPHVALVSRIDELVTTTVAGTETVASVENLASPGATYSYLVTPVNSVGAQGAPSDAGTFTASTEPYQLVGSSLQSSNWESGTTGWRITSDGTAEFNGGALAVTSIDIGGANDTSFHVDVDGNMWSGAATYALAPFAVSASGSMAATEGTFSGAITGGTIDIGNTAATSFHVDATGQLWLGAATYDLAPFKVSSTGSLTATDGTFTGTVSTGAVFGAGTGAGAGGAIKIESAATINAAASGIYNGFATAGGISNAGSFSAGGDEASAGSVTGFLIGDTGKAVFQQVNTPYVGALSNANIQFGNTAYVRRPNNATYSVYQLRNIRIGANNTDYGSNYQTGDILFVLA